MTAHCCCHCRHHRSSWRQRRWRQRIQSKQRDDDVVNCLLEQEGNNELHGSSWPSEHVIVVVIIVVVVVTIGSCCSGREQMCVVMVWRCWDGEVCWLLNSGIILWDWSSLGNYINQMSCSLGQFSRRLWVGQHRPSWITSLMRDVPKIGQSCSAVGRYPQPSGNSYRVRISLKMVILSATIPAL